MLQSLEWKIIIILLITTNFGYWLFEYCFFFGPIKSLHFFSPIQFQASSWKNLILKVCRGAYPPLPSHLPYELHYLFKQMFKTNPRDRPSVHTILTSHRASRLLRAHLSWQVMPPPSPPSSHAQKCSSLVVGLPARRRSIKLPNLKSFNGRPSVTAARSHNTVSKWAFKLLHNFPSCGEPARNLTFDKPLLVQMATGLMFCVWFTALLLTFLQAPELEQQGRRARRWDREEGVKVASRLAEKSLITSSTSEGRVKKKKKTAIIGFYSRFCI